MAHVYTQARSEVATRLGTVADLVTVSTNRGRHFEDHELPAALVATGVDEVESASKTKGTEPLEKRTVTLDVVLIANGDDETLDDTLDGLRAEVEKAVGDGDDLGGLAHRVTHTGGELDIGTDEDGARWYAFLTLTWSVEVWTLRGDPETAV